jgi:hypothetical protein
MPPPFGFSSEILETLIGPKRRRSFVDMCSRDGVEKSISCAAEGRFVILSISGAGAGSSVCAGEELLYSGGEVDAPKRSGCELPRPEEGCSDGRSPIPPLLLLPHGNDRVRTREGWFEGTSAPPLYLLLAPDILLCSPAKIKSVRTVRAAVVSANTLYVRPNVVLALLAVSGGGSFVVPL